MSTKQKTVVPVEIAVGDRFMLHCSYEFPGIEDGAVTILEIVQAGEESTIATSALWEQHNIWVSSGYMTEEQAQATVWVVYNVDSENHTALLPSTVFVGHATTL